MSSVLKSPSTQPYNEIVEVTPELAASWLECNEGNRTISWNYVHQLARDMKTGRFVCTHQGIAFDTEGNVIDGQHRLWAVLEADVPVRIRVFYNESPENIMHIDGNTPRRAADRMSLDHRLGTVRPDELATLRAMLAGAALAPTRRTVAEEMDLLETHREAIQFAHEHLPQTRPSGIANAATRAVIARAWYCAEEPSCLIRFCRLLRTGVGAGPCERVVMMLRDQLVQLGHKSSTLDARRRQYALTARAVLAYNDSEHLASLRPATCELFLLPDEVPSAA